VVGDPVKIILYIFPIRAQPGSERSKRKGKAIPHIRRRSLAEKKILVTRKQEVAGLPRREVEIDRIARLLNQTNLW